MRIRNALLASTAASAAVLFQLGLALPAQAQSADYKALVCVFLYGGVDGKPLVYEGVAEALSVPNTDLRLFGKPESFVKRRMGVALAAAHEQVFRC